MSNKEYVDNVVDNIIHCISDGIKERLQTVAIIKRVKNIIAGEKEMLSLMAVYTMASYFSALVDNNIDHVKHPIYDMVGGVLISELF